MDKLVAGLKNHIAKALKDTKVEIIFDPDASEEGDFSSKLRGRNVWVVRVGAKIKREAFKNSKFMGAIEELEEVGIQCSPFKCVDGEGNVPWEFTYTGGIPLLF